MSRNTVSDVVLAVLAEAGVERIYGIPGDAINSLIESVRTQDAIQFVQVRHEEAAAFAASVEAKLTGELAACVGTAGPGAIHLLNGLYDAKLDHAPVIAITGQVPTERLGSDYHQEVDLYTLFKDVSVFNEVVVNPAQLAFSLPGAIGVQMAHPGRQVIALAGDGGFVMLMGDLLTAVKYELPITIVIFNNGKLGLIQMEQEVQGYPEFQTALANPDFARVAQACRAEGYTVRDPSELEATLRAALATDRTSVVDVSVNPEERTLPPAITAAQAFGYGRAKAGEFFGLGDKNGGTSAIRGLLSGL